MRALKHNFAFVRPSAMWQSGGSQDLIKMQRPALLCFKVDGFMQDLAARLQQPGADLSPLEAVPETNAERLPGNDPPAPGDLKLFQAVHGRHYLVATSLVCQLPGLPDHRVDKSKSERAAFVLRRLGSDGLSELAWVSDGNTPPKKSWQPVGDARQIADNEELIPGYPVLYPEGPRKRRILVGLVPTVSRETYETRALAPSFTQVDPRDFDVNARVVEPLVSLQANPYDGSHAEQDREGSRYLLLDLADFFAQQLPAFWNQLTVAAPPTQPKALALYHLLDTRTIEVGSGISFRQGLVRAMAEHSLINDGQPGTLSCNLHYSDIDPTQLRQALADILAENPLPAGTAAPAAGVPKLDKPLSDTDNTPARYVLRALYRRPLCVPPHPDVVSNPTEPFQIAPHFDFEAPARPIRISLPFDTSIAGLRKFKKSVGFVMSQQLRKQLCRSSTDFKNILDGKLAACDDVSFGEICSFSIPILTIVAMILMMIIVTLLNFVFWWIPFLKICLPIRTSR